MMLQYQFEYNTHRTDDSDEKVLYPLTLTHQRPRNPNAFKPVRVGTDTIIE